MKSIRVIGNNIGYNYVQTIKGKNIKFPYVWKVILKSNMHEQETFLSLR